MVGLKTKSTTAFYIICRGLIYSCSSLNDDHSLNQDQFVLFIQVGSD